MRPLRSLLLAGALVAGTLATSGSSAAAQALQPTADSPLLSAVPSHGSIGSPEAPADTTRRRSVEYSDWYGRRLTIHRIGSYAMLPLFGAQYYLGNKLLDGDDAAHEPHRVVAYGVGALFVTNTVTGLWNLWDARNDPSGRTRRLLHVGLMLAADAGFAYTGTLADDARASADGRTRHRNAALTAIGVSTAGAALMWLWKE